MRSLTLRIVVGLAFGVIVGLVAGVRVAPLGELGKIVITLIKAAATPLLFLFILRSILTTEITGRLGARLLRIVGINALCALAIGIGISQFFRAGESLRGLHPPPAESTGPARTIGVIDTVKSYFPESLAKPFVDNAMVSLILIALLFGFALRSLRAAPGEAALVDRLAEILGLLIRVFEVVLSWLIALVPLAVFGVVAKTVGEHGFAPLAGLARYLGVGLLGLALHVVVVYQAWLARRGVPLRAFWRSVRPTLVYAWGVNSSLATLPLTLRKLKELGVSDRSATLGACVGTNLNNDGILLYEAMAVFFVAQAAGIPLDLPTQVTAAFVCVLGTIGIAGIPEAGFITLSVALATLGLPTEILPMLLAVDWILGRARTVVNVLGDMTVSIALDDPKPSKI